MASYEVRAQQGGDGDGGGEDPGTDDNDIPGIDRLLALTDGVVAIALTLLVLQLQVPAEKILNSHADSASSLWHALRVSGDGSELTSYLVSFVVIAQFWVVHHRVLRTMRGHSEGLAWRNFSFLLALTLMPFTSDLLGRFGDNPLAITLFGLNLIALSVTTQWIFWYVSHHNLVVEGTHTEHDTLAARARALVLIAIVGLSVLLAWTEAGLAKYVWFLFILVPATGERIARRIERHRSRARPT